MTLTVGSLCTGYSGIEQALHLAGWDTELAWVAEYDPTPDPGTGKPKPEPQAAQRLLAYRHPNVPNHGDITAVDWANVPPVDIVTAGFPCTDLSCAGRQAGLGTGTRSGVWANVAEAIAVLRPRLVLIENVAALLSTRANRSTDAADRDLEPGPAGMGNGADRPALRALGAVLGDLSEIGFDAVWATISAASIGAPHRRDRVFVLAWPADTPGDPWWLVERDRAAAVAGAVRPAGRVDLLPTPAARLADKRGMPSVETAAARMWDEGRRNLEDAVALLPTPASRDWRSGESNIMDRNARPLNEVVVNLLPTPRTNDGRGPGVHGDGGPDLRTAVSLLPTPRAIDGTNGGPNQRGSSGDLMLPSAVMLLPTPTVADSRGTRNATAGRTGPPATTRTNHDGWTLSDVAHADRWGRYAPAIARWEQILDRPAPDPTEPGSKGQPRLSPRFVEFLMGLPDGHVTAVPGLSRNDQLRLLGNGVVPQQGAAALTHLMRIRAHLPTSRPANASGTADPGTGRNPRRGGDVGRM